MRIYQIQLKFPFSTPLHSDDHLLEIYIKSSKSSQIGMEIPTFLTSILLLPIVKLSKLLQILLYIWD